jgi:hypothetical protein
MLFRVIFNAKAPFINFFREGGQAAAANTK